MARCKTSKLTTTIIDELRLCYTAESSLLNEFGQMKIGENIRLHDYMIYRVRKERFEYGFDVMTDIDTRVAQLYFGHKCEGVDDNRYIWLRAENATLYNSALLKDVIIDVADLLDLRFSHITSMDLAKDFTKNTTYTIDKLLRNKNITTILNNKAIKDRRKELKELGMWHSRSLDRICNPTLYIKQRKAIHDKSQGICVTSYNKLAEINESQKQYILEFYNNPKRLHRLEVHQNTAEIKDYCAARNIEQTIDLIFDNDFLTDMYFYHLGAVLRFTEGRKRLAWSDILRCSNRV